MSYTFVTLEEIQELWESAPTPIPVWASQLFDRCERTLSERDAYRALAFKIIHDEFNNAEQLRERVDAEAARIMERGK